MAMRIDGFHHAAISVPNLNEAITWYGDLLGFVVEREWKILAADMRAAYLTHGAMRFEVFEVGGAVCMDISRRDPRADLKTHGHKHIGFSVSEYEACRAEIIERGIKIILDVGEVFGRAFFINDPFGNVIEFVESIGCDKAASQAVEDNNESYQGASG